VPDNTTEEDSLEDQVDNLETKVERLEERNQGKNQLEIKAYDIRIKGSSEETDMSELLELFSDQMDDLLKQALIGEYQQIEREDLFSQLMGDD